MRNPLLALLAVLCLTAAGGVWAVVGALVKGDPPGPTVSSFSLVGSPPTNASSVSWRVVFSASVTGVAASNFQLVPGGGVSGAGSISVSGSGPTYTVSASTGSGSGTLGLKLATAGSIKDSGGHALQGAPYTGPVFAIDKTAPTASIVLNGVSPTNAASVSWTVTFSESVTGVSAGGFSLVPVGVSGAGSVSVSGGPASYTVSASTGSGSETLGLKIPSAGSIKDLAGNGLAGTPVSGPAYTIDKTPPPAPSISSGPSSPPPVSSTNASFGFSDAESGVSFLCKLDTGAFAACSSPKSYSGLADGSHSFQVEARDAAGNTSAPASFPWTVDTTPPPRPTVTASVSNPTTSTSVTFSFSDGEGGVSFACKLDGAQFAACTSPQSYSGLALGTHTFSVRAIDPAGNRSKNTDFTWMITSSSALPYTIGAVISGSLYPGAAASPINLTFQNPNSDTVLVSSLSVSIASLSAPNSSLAHPCSQTDYQLTQYSGGSFQIPVGSSSLSSLSIAAGSWPTIRMLDSGNQDGCKGATVNLTFGGHS